MSRREHMSAIAFCSRLGSIYNAWVEKSALSFWHLLVPVLFVGRTCLTLHKKNLRSWLFWWFPVQLTLFCQQCSSHPDDVYSNRVCCVLQGMHAPNSAQAKLWFTSIDSSSWVASIRTHYIWSRSSHLCQVLLLVTIRPCSARLAFDAVLSRSSQFWATDRLPRWKVSRISKMPRGFFAPSLGHQGWWI